MGTPHPDLAQLAEHLTVVVVVIKGSPVRIRQSGIYTHFFMVINYNGK
tara:strand:- start:291 stop:434 length:144 start_codon:yes stop_codon:yes gene_type:complete